MSVCPKPKNKSRLPKPDFFETKFVVAKSPNYITPNSFKKLQDELKQLLHVERPQVVKTVAWAAGNGDRSENADYIYGKKRLRELDRRIRFLQQRIEAAVVIDPKTQAGDVVQFGATVTLADDSGIQKNYTIVGVDELEPVRGWISWQSPLAKALIGKKVGDWVVFKRPAGEIEYQIIAVVWKGCG